MNKSEIFTFIDFEKPSIAFFGARTLGPLFSSDLDNVFSGNPVTAKTNRRGVLKDSIASKVSFDSIRPSFTRFLRLFSAFD